MTAAACVLVAGVIAGPGGRIAQQVLAGGSLTDLLSGRSPGERGTAGLINIKGAPLGLSRSAPQQRVLPLLRSRGPIALGEDPILDGAGAPFPSDDAFNAVDFANTPDVETLLPPGGTPGFGGPSFGGGGFPGFPPGNPGLLPTDDPTPLPPVQSPVPEPATWLMLIMGFGTVGAALRRRTAVAPAGAETKVGVGT